MNSILDILYEALEPVKDTPGELKAIQDLDQACQVLPEPEVLFLSAKGFQHSSIRGDLMDSPEAREVLSEFIRGGGSPL